MRLGLCVHHHQSHALEPFILHGLGRISLLLFFQFCVVVLCTIKISLKFWWFISLKWTFFQIRFLQFGTITPWCPPHNEPAFLITQGHAEHMSVTSQDFLDNRNGITRDPRRTGLIRQTPEYSRRDPYAVPKDKVFLLNSPWPPAPLPHGGPAGRGHPGTACFTKLILLVLYQRWRENNITTHPPYIQATGMRKCAKTVWSTDCALQNSVHGNHLDD